jgi:hypothetical protein
LTGNTTITSTNDVTILSESFLDSGANANALWKIPFAIAVGVGISNAYVNIEDNTNIQAANDVLIRSKATGDSEVKSTMVKKLDIDFETNGDANWKYGGISFAILVSIIDSKIEMDPTASITAGRFANLQAKGVNNAATNAAFTLFEMIGYAGFTASVDVAISDVNAIVNGQITATGSTTADASLLTIDTSAIDYTTNIFYYENHGLQTGDYVTYTYGSTPTIGGLEQSGVYLVVVIDEDGQ